MRVHVGADHAAFDTKNQVVEALRQAGHEVVDHGAFVYDAEDDYPVFCLRAAEAVAADPDSRGVVLGGSGNGELIAANKVRGVRAALAWSDETARLAREHNDATVVAVGARMHAIEDVTAFIEAFLNTPYSGEERHTGRIGMLTRYEESGELPPLPSASASAPSFQTSPSA
ncbi:ribose-5-phosphate isomerase [Actinobacteria bacterium YIM 96077]|uniref:Ribose-5-phosphate isomerase B n=1 Tax=Phytoactinopolyspora halophila TaxID=1981511 RepID=A0A329R204_9ACTN|nr:ribose-5-phosphate isomerase [Phytoactinopolyspora halophila]AYY12165.1 ribose-5-phosphate isomerase [Actinobacteria bacterium YIM 96077]RAW18600.1 ribose-5-phosphate isomerase [Phytoactinopolyspora halophila]